MYRIYRTWENASKIVLRKIRNVIHLQQSSATHGPLCDSVLPAVKKVLEQSIFVLGDSLQLSFFFTFQRRRINQELSIILTLCSYEPRIETTN